MRAQNQPSRRSASAWTLARPPSGAAAT
jgi:hypothetical protein